MLLGGLFAILGPSSPAGATALKLDSPRQLKGGDVPRFQGVDTRHCMQFVSAQPAYVTHAPCMAPMPISYAQLWLIDSTTHQISVTLPSELGARRLCLDSLGMSAAGTPVQVTPCLTDGTLPGFASQRWDLVPSYAPDMLRNRANGLCIGTEFAPVIVPDPLVMEYCSGGWAVDWFSLDAVWPLSGFVWSDLNGNGIKDVGEPGVGGVRVHVRDANGAPLDPDMTTLTSTNTSDGNLGRYQFAVPVGTWRVQAELPAGYAFTLQDAPGSSEANDSDFNGSGLTDQIAAPEPDVLDVQPGPAYTQVNAGLVAA